MKIRTEYINNLYLVRFCANVLVVDRRLVLVFWEAGVGGFGRPMEVSIYQAREK